MKKLVIINGITGAIGSACLAHFGFQKDVVVYGISRKACDLYLFTIEDIDRKLPASTLICSISENDAYRAAYSFVSAINEKNFSEIIYIHAVGFYPFEIDNKGNHIVDVDLDEDGIDDRCDELTRHLFCAFYQAISFMIKKPMHAFLFGGIADKHEPVAHRSWWTTMNKTKQVVKLYQKNNPESGYVSLVNISSVLCPNELITRPFVFSQTDAHPIYWLTPMEVVLFLQTILSSGQEGKFKEYELFKKKPNFNLWYYEDENFTPRKVAEIYGVQISL